MIPTSLAVLALVALAASAPTTNDGAPNASNRRALASADIAIPEDIATASFATLTAPAAPVAGGASSTASLTYEVEEEVPAGELGAGEDMEGAENIVFRPLFRYRERTPARRRVRNSNRRRDTNYRNYASRFPHRRYRTSPKRRTVPHVHHQVLY